MPTDMTVQAISTELQRAEQLVDQQIGWSDGVRAVLGLFSNPDTGFVRAEMLPFQPDWEIALPDGSGNLPVPFVLRAFAEALTNDPPAWFHDWRSDNSRYLVGAVFLCEAWVSKLYAGYEYGDLRALPAMAETEARLLVAVDTDGRLYELIRVRGEQPTLTVTDDPSPQQRADNIPAAVYQLTAALCSG